MRKTEIYRGHWSNIVKSIISNIYFIFIALIILMKIKRNSNFIIFIIAISIIIIGCAISVWRSRYFYIKDNMFIYIKGMINKTKEQIPLKQITTVDIKTTLLDRVLGSVTLKLNSGNATLNEAEFEMIVKKEDALLIKSIVSGQENNEEMNKEVNELRVEIKDIVIYALTKNKFGWIMLIFVIGNKFSKIFDNFIFDYVKNYFWSLKDYILYANTFDSALRLIIIFAYIYFFSIIISICMEILKYGNFRITRNEDSFNISYGIINLKEYAISLDKIQGVKFRQNLLQQLLNLYKINAIVIGDNEINTLLFPCLNRTSKEKFINKFLPEYNIVKEMDKAPRKSIFRFIFKRFICSIIFAFILILLIKHFIPKVYMIRYFKFLILLVLGVSQIILGYIDYLNNGISIENDKILLTNGSRIRNTYIVRKFKVRSLQINQSILQRYKDICNYKVDIATNSFGETIEIKNMDINKYEDIL